MAGLEEQDASAKALEARVEAVADLLAKCAVLQDRAAHLVPDAKPDDPFEDLAGLSLDHEVTLSWPTTLRPHPSLSASALIPFSA